MADYVEITHLVTPDEAAAGSLVDVTVGFKSKASVTFTAMIVGVPEYPGLPPATYIDGLAPHEYKVNIPPGGLYSCSGWFTMPSSDVTVHIYAYYYGADKLFHLDDEKTKNVEVAGAGVVGWYQADVKTISITRGPELVEGWYQADVRVIYVNKGPALVEGWYQADVRVIYVNKGPALVEGWYQADVKIITVTRPGVEPPDGDEEGKFPWGVALLAAGGAVALAAAIPKKKTEGKKTPAKKKG